MWRFNASFFSVFLFRSFFPVGLNILTHTACCRVHSGTDYVYVISLDLFMDQDWIQAGHCILGDMNIRIKCCHSHRIIPCYKHELNPLCTKLIYSKPCICQLEENFELTVTKMYASIKTFKNPVQDVTDHVAHWQSRNIIHFLI